MNTHVIERERRLALALAEEMAVVVGALLNRPAAATEVRETAGGGPGWLLRWRLGGPLEGRLAATIDGRAARDFVQLLSGLTVAPGDETVANGLCEVAGQVASGLSRNPAVEGAFVTSSEPPSRDGLEAGATAMTYDIAAEDFRMGVTCRAALDEAASSRAGERHALSPVAPRGTSAPATAPANLGVILDIDLPLVVRFAQTTLTLQALSRLGPGSILDLDRSPEDVVDVLVNGVTIARGEVVVTAGNYGVRITEVVNAVERMRVMAS